MEQSVKSAGNQPYQNNSRISMAYSSNKIRQNVSFRNKQKYITSFSSSVVNSYKGKSLNKIQFEKQSSKLNGIKLRCMQTSKLNSKILAKQISIPKDFESDALNISYNLEDETDDAQLQLTQNSKIMLRASRFEGRPPTVFFQYPKCCEISNEPLDAQIYPLQRGEMWYKINGSEYKCIINSLECNGFRKCENGKQWNIYFDIKGTKTKKIENMARHQKINHFPGCWYIGRKDFLWRGINKMRRSHPEEYNFVPLTYLMPSDYDRFELARENSNKGDLWILKPAAAACGRGIKMIAKDTKIRNKKDFLISQYIKNPHLINNLKYDLRIYVLVSSYDPLRIYLFDEGLVRFATHEYNCKTKDIKKRFVHLTNFSVNKHSKNFIKANDENGGSKWSFTALKRYYESVGIDSSKLFKRIEDVIIKTCISAEPNMLNIYAKTQEKRNCCFEIYGFDILIDSDLKPWLMEVNVCPSLSSSSPLDRRIKHALLTDVLNLIGIEYNSVKQQEKLKKKLKESFAHLQGGRKIYSRNINVLENLNFDNCVQLLSPDDWLVLFESQEQLDRLGKFKKIFPVASNISTYEHLFQFKRYYNLMLWKCLESQCSFFDKIYSS